MCIICVGYEKLKPMNAVKNIYYLDVKIEAIYRLSVKGGHIGVAVMCY